MSEVSFFRVIFSCCIKENESNDNPTQPLIHNGPGVRPRATLPENGPERQSRSSEDSKEESTKSIYYSATYNSDSSSVDGSLTKVAKETTKSFS